MQNFCIQPGSLSLEILAAAFEGPIEVQLEKQCWENVNRSHQAVLDLLASGDSIYGLFCLYVYIRILVMLHIAHVCTG